MKSSKLKEAICFISASLFFVIAIFCFFKADTLSAGIVWMSLGAVFLCLGAVTMKKNRKDDK